MMKVVKGRMKKTMLECEGYWMFRGKATVIFPNGKTFCPTATWLFKPDNNRWYITPCEDFPCGTSFAEESVTEIVEE